MRSKTSWHHHQTSHVDREFHKEVFSFQNIKAFDAASAPCRDPPYCAETYLTPSILYVDNASTPLAGRTGRYGPVHVSELSSVCSVSQTQQLVLMEALEFAGAWLYRWNIEATIRIYSNLFIPSSYYSCLNHIPNAYFINSPYWHSDKYRFCWNVSVTTRISAAWVDFWNLFLTLIYLGRLFMLAQFVLEFCLPGSLRTWNSTRVFVSDIHNKSNVCKIHIIIELTLNLKLWLTLNCYKYALLKIIVQLNQNTEHMLVTFF